MEDRYEVRLYNHTAELLAVFDSWRSLGVHKVLNGVSSHTFSIAAADSRIPLFLQDHLFEVRRKPADNSEWQQEYFGFHITPRFQISENGYEIFTSYGRSMEDLLDRRSLAYTAPYSLSGLADNVMKQLVYENAGDGAVSPPRILDGTTPGLLVQAATGLGPVWEGDRTYKPLMAVLQEIALATHVDFNVVLALAGGVEFRTYFPLGTDRTVTTGIQPLIFAPEFGNMAVPDYTYSATEEVTEVIALGTGQGGARLIQTGTSPAISVSPFNKRELVRDSRNDGSLTALQAVVDKELQQSAARENFTFRVIQTPSCIYGVHYNLGDLITARMGAIVRDKRILGVDITVSEDRNSLDFDFGDSESIPRTPQGITIKVVQNLIRRLQYIEHSGAI